MKTDEKVELTCGMYLKKVREQKGITLDKASQDSRIIKRLIQAIENDDYNSLPPPVYLKGLIKKYAHYLHLDEEEILKFYQKSNGRKLTPGDKDLLPQNRFAYKQHPLLKIFSQIFGQIIRYSLLLIILFYLVFEIMQLVLPAQIIIFYPPRDLMTTLPEITISGQVIRTKTLYFQGQETSFDNKGFFKEQMTLNPGSNILEFEAINALGKKTTLEQKVILSSL